MGGIGRPSSLVVLAVAPDVHGDKASVLELDTEMTKEKEAAMRHSGASGFGSHSQPDLSPGAVMQKSLSLIATTA